MNNWRYYQYHQNPPHDTTILFDPAVGLSNVVIIEAPNASEANLIARSRGMRLEVCECDCCDPRWRAIPYDYNGYPFPNIYGEPITAEMLQGKKMFRRFFSIPHEQSPFCFVIKADGKVIPVHGVQV